MISRFSICTLFLSFRLFAFRVHSEQFYLLSSFEEFAPNFNNKLFAAHKENTNYLSLEVVLLCRSAALLPLSPLRTVRATFTAYSSDNSKFNSHKIKSAHNHLLMTCFR